MHLRLRRLTPLVIKFYSAQIWRENLRTTATLVAPTLQDVNVKDWAGVVLGRRRTSAQRRVQSSPGSVNSSLFAGTTGLTATGTSLNANITNTVTVSGTVTVNQGTSPWVVSLASTTITGTVVAVGNLTNNNAAPTAALQGVLPAIAETAYATVTYTTGDMVLPVTDLHGALNQDLQAYAGTQLTGKLLIANRRRPGTTSSKSSSRLPAISADWFDRPVTLPPGRADFGHRAGADRISPRSRTRWESNQCRLLYGDDCRGTGGDDDIDLSA